MFDLSRFRRPQWYAGNEFNAIRKSHHAKIKICIAYPDLYDIGMSNLGLRIIYGLLNSYTDVACERVFMPGKDMLSFLLKSKTKLFSLENKIPIDRFDVVGFNFGYELNFTNFLAMLDSGGLPLYSRERKETIVLGGGIVNPEPVADFVDVFFMGEFEESAGNFLDILRQYPKKEERLKALSEVKGFYVPKFYSNRTDKHRYEFIKEYECARSDIERVYVKDINSSFFPRKWLTPYTSIIHDRVPIEISRGCPNRCNFCQARAVYSPYREKSPEVITNLVKDIYKSSGYENFSFLSLSASEYSAISELIDGLYKYFEQNRIGLSLPSLRVDDITEKLHKKIFSLKKTSLTVAVEASTDKLRSRLNKRIDINKLFEAVKFMKSFGTRHIKIYFMFGLPHESDTDLSAIGEFLRKVNRISRLKINASINVFIPKPFSLWQDMPMVEEAELLRRKNIILGSLGRKNNVKVSFSPIKKSILEAIISRADREFSSVILKAYLKGALFDGYKEKFSWPVWKECIEESGYDYSKILAPGLFSYPWSFINAKYS